MESTTTFCVRVILRHSKNNFSESLIYARITVNIKRAEMSLNKTVNPNCWDSKKQCVFGSKELITRINPYLDEIRYKLNDCYQQLKMKNVFITVEAIKRSFFGEPEKQNFLLTLIAYHTSSTKGILNQGALKNYSSTEKYIKKFLQFRYKTDNVLLAEFNYQFITQFEFFLRTTEPLEKIIR